MHHFAIDYFDPAKVGISLQPTGGQIAIFKMRRGFKNPRARCGNTRLGCNTGMLKFVLSLGDFHRRNIHRLA